MKKNIILTDCEKDEVEEFVDGFSKVLGEPIEVFSCVCNRDHGSKLKNIKRYLCYIFYPISFVIHGKKYKYVIGWQQFYALFYAFFMGLFHLKRKNVIVCCNFTYISKGKTFIGKLYKKFMTYCVKNLDYIHVLSMC